MPILKKNSKFLTITIITIFLIVFSSIIWIKGELNFVITIPSSGIVKKDLGNLGIFNKWSKVEFSVIGPNSLGTSNEKNPFKIELDVFFNSPTNKTFKVPGFYDGDGHGGMDGNAWKVRFSPDESGTWSLRSNSTNSILDDYYGTFEVIHEGETFFERVGRLEYVDEHYLKFVDGPYWIKGGIDDPENFLGTPFGSWQEKKTAVDFLASYGVNSIYVMLHNVGGDGDDVWPWISRTDTEHFDVAKLNLWEDFFEYVQSKGIILHLVFEDDSAWKGFNRDMYYREMIARFSHHNGLYWNIAEEYNENYGKTEVKDFVNKIKSLDPYDHSIAIHNWNSFTGEENFEVTSIQTGKTPQNSLAVTWWEETETAGHKMVISFDETGKIYTDDRDLARKIVWSVYLGGGNIELHIKPETDYQSFVNHMNDMYIARQFMETLPFWEMSPNNHLVTTGDAYVFANLGEEYVIYLEYGGSITLDLSHAAGNMYVEWFNPLKGEYSNQSPIQGGTIQNFTAPDTNDWVLHIEKQ